jgi:hypothetical protein
MIAALGVATSLACTRPNPAFDDSDGAAAGDPGPGSTFMLPTSEPPTTGTTASTTSTTSTAASSGTVDPTTDAIDMTTTTSVGSSTGAPICAKLGESCGACCGCGTCQDGICLPDSGQCGPCEECQDTGCVPLPAGKDCTPPGSDTCSDKLWGLMDGDCFANGPLLGTCDDQGTCNEQACDVKGELLVDCDASCIKDPGECQQGEPLEFDAMKLCEFDGTTEACNTKCVPNVNGDFTYVNSCHAGLCEEDSKTPCGNYRCRDDLQGCQTSCMDANDCVFTKQCVNGVCQN